MVRPWSWTYIKGKIKQFRMVVLCRLGIKNDLVGYETLINYAEKSNIHLCDGDFLEIGGFMGGGSSKLAKYAKGFDKKLIVVDPFEPDLDSTKNNRNEQMSTIYKKMLGKRNLYELFLKNTRGEKNIIVYKTDSKKLKLPNNTRLCFTFIDGNHNPQYVKSDFKMAWENTASGGVVGLHDYGGALEQTTKAIDVMIKQYRNEISGKEIIKNKSIIFLKRK